jgi:hypothetical protein
MPPKNGAGPASCDDRSEARRVDRLGGPINSPNSPAISSKQASRGELTGAIVSSLDPWTEIREGRADQAGANIYWLYAGIQKNDLKLIASTLKSIIKHEDWRKWRWIGSEFGCSSLRECLLTHPPKGVGADLDLLRRLILDDKHALDMLDEALRNPHGTNQHRSDLYNVQAHKAPTGNSIEAILRRLRGDDRPTARELHAKVLAGEMSAHRAAVLAGYRHKLTPLQQIERLIPKLTAEESRQLMAMLAARGAP